MLLFVFGLPVYLKTAPNSPSSGNTGLQHDYKVVRLVYYVIIKWSGRFTM